MTVADRTMTPPADTGLLRRRAATSQRTVERLRLLAKATAEVSATFEIDEALDRLVRVVVPELADAAAVHLSDGLGAGGRTRRVRAASAVDPYGEPAAGCVEQRQLRLIDDDLIEEVLRTARVVVRDLTAYPATAGLRAATSTVVARPHTLVGAPLVVAGVVSGVLSLVAAGDRPVYDDADLLLVRELATRGAAALEQARSFGRARETAVTLQRSLLPQAHVTLDDGEAVSRYVPGGDGAEVGGDWHDVLDLGAGRVALVIGDVMGRGVQAAGVMGQVRSAVRAYARQDLPPGELLELLDGLVADLGEAHLATCAYAVHDPADGSLTIARAGHVPPLLRRPDGVVEVLEREPGHPLGVGRGVFPEHRLVLPAGGVLVLCTDGLVESGRLDVDRGLRELREALRDEPDDLDAFADGLLRRLGMLAGTDDDVALLVVRLPPVRPDRAAHLELTLGPRSVAQAREFAAAHAGRLGIPATALPTAQLLVSELATNSLLHGERPVRMRLRRTPTRLVVEVSDAGRQVPQRRRAQEDEEGGRGLFLVSSLAHRWGVRPQRAGKVVWCELLLPPP